MLDNSYHIFYKSYFEYFTNKVQVLFKTEDINSYLCLEKLPSLTMMPPAFPAVFPNDVIFESRYIYIDLNDYVYFIELTYLAKI